MISNASSNPSTPSLPDDPPMPERPPEEVLMTDLLTDPEDDPLEAIAQGELNQDDLSLNQRVFRLRLPDHTGADVTGGDVDDDWYQAEVVGEEAVGGDNPTPDQNVTEDLQRSMGISSNGHESIRTHEKLCDRDDHRWELEPESAEDFGDRD
ncbi:MAG: DUF6335 family protein [Synechococcales bacterium]|nr:DUF6335 family protein [Synechococcales bacterium]